MRRNIPSRSWVRRAVLCAVALLFTAGLPAPAAPAASGAATAVPPGAARIWFYRDYEPYGSRNFAPLSLNGALVGYSQPDGSAFYRDVAPGRYHISVASDGLDVNQTRDVELGPGQQAFVKILASNTWESGGDTHSYRRDTFYITLVPPQIAEAELPTRPLRGG